MSPQPTIPYRPAPGSPRLDSSVWLIHQRQINGWSTLALGQRAARMSKPPQLIDRSSPTEEVA
jgi:hypothetical protein